MAKVILKNLKKVYPNTEKKKKPKKGEEVKKLQRVLIDNKLLSGEPDGQFGKYTAEAVKEMQRKFGMEATGVADQAFLDKLYESANQ